MDEQLSKLCERTAKLETGYITICNDIKEIKEKLLGRPSWAVVVIITFLSSLSIGLIVLNQK